MKIENTKITIGVTAAITALIFIVSFSVSVGRWQEGTENDVRAVQEDLQKICNEVDALDERVSRQDVKHAEIMTELLWIKTTLVEIKERRK